MTRSRIILIGLGLAMLGAGYFLYQNLPEFLRQSAQLALRRYGVQDFEFEGLRIHPTQASIDTMSLRGALGNFTYSGRVTSGAIHYNWRTLLSGRFESLSLSSVALSLTQAAGGDNRSPAIIHVADVLPQRLIAALPLQALRIENWQIDYHSPTNRTFDLHGSLTIDQRIDLQLRTALATCEVAAALQGTTRSPDVQLKLSITSGEASVATLSAQLTPSVDNTWEWRLQGQAQHTPLLSCLRAAAVAQGLAPAMPVLAMEGESTLTAQVHHPDTLDLAAAQGADVAALRQVHAKLHLDSDIRRLDLRSLAQHINGKLTLDTVLDNARVDGTLQAFTLTGDLDAQRLALPASWQRWLNWGPTIPVHLQTAAPLAFSFGDNSDWSVQAHNTRVSLGDDDSQLRLDQLQLNILTRGERPLLVTTQLDTRLATRELQIHSGRINLTTALSSQDFDFEHWQQRSQLTASNISGNYQDYAFDGLALTAGWSGMTRWKTEQPLELSVATFNPGFVVKDLKLQASLPNATPITQPQVRIDAFSAGVFGGQLTLPDRQAWDFAAPSNRITLAAHGWQLGELVALQQKAEIQAQGTLEGELPVTVANGRLLIDNGYLRALPPGGSIRYHPDDNIRALADGNAQLALALELLRDFHYEHLGSEVQLDKTGKLLLALSLSGNNPGLYDGQAVQFNIKVEQNLDPLLQSLRIDDNLEQRIERGLQ